MGPGLKKITTPKSGKQAIVKQLGGGWRQRVKVAPIHLAVRHVQLAKGVIDAHDTKNFFSTYITQSAVLQTQLLQRNVHLQGGDHIHGTISHTRLGNVQRGPWGVTGQQVCEDDCILRYTNRRRRLRISNQEKNR